MNKPEEDQKENETGGAKQPVFMTKNMHGVMLNLRTSLGAKMNNSTEVFLAEQLVTSRDG